MTESRLLCHVLFEKELCNQVYLLGAHEKYVHFSEYGQILEHLEFFYLKLLNQQNSALIDENLVSLMIYSFETA